MNETKASPAPGADIAVAAAAALARIKQTKHYEIDKEAVFLKV